MTTRAAVAAAAIEWAGTPYHHRAAIKGVGADCALFPAAVYKSVGLIPAIDPVYPQDWHLHRSAELYVDWALDLGATEIAEADIGVGDLGLWRWGRTFSHGGILLAPDRLIHAVQDVGVTLDNPTEQEDLKRRERRWFTFWPRQS